jgi:hypothetical protein
LGVRIADHARVLTRRAGVACAIALCGFVYAPSARAADVEISGSSVGQFYEVGSPWGYEIARRRFLQTLGFSVYHLQGDHAPGKADYNLRVMLRVDADFGLGQHLADDIAGAEDTYALANGGHFVPGLNTARFDLMMAYVEGRNVADGWFTFRAGRQLVSDALGWWSFDGGLVRLQTPAYFDVELLGGLEQRGGLPLSTSRYEPQGVWRGSHGGFDGDDEARASFYPSYQFASYAPAFGFALESSGPNWLHARASYRRVYNTGEAFTRQFEDPAGGYPTVDGLRISSEKVGFAATVNKTDLGGLKGGLSYDLYNQLFPTVYGGVEAYLGSQVTVGIDADHYNPTFDADSIFNWFTHNPTTTATGRVEARFTKHIDMSAQGGVRLWSTEGDPAEYGDIECRAAGFEAGCKKAGVQIDPSGDYKPLSGDGSTLGELVRTEENRPTVYTLDGLGQLAARFQHPLGKVEARGMLQVGDRGHRGGADVSGEKSFDAGRYSVGGRLSLFDFGNPLAAEAEDENVLTFGYVLGAAVKPIDLAKVGVEWEHDVNERVGQRFRVMARLDVLWSMR